MGAWMLFRLTESIPWMILPPIPSNQQVYAPNVVGALLSLAQVGAFVLYSSPRWKGAAAAAAGVNLAAKRPSLSEFLLEAPHGAGGSPVAGGSGGQEVTLL